LKHGKNRILLNRIVYLVKLFLIRRVKIFIIVKVYLVQLKKGIMKKGITYLAIILFVASLASSCGSRKAHCGAYSKVEKQVEQRDANI
jgi:hypothetical protein